MADDAVAWFEIRLAGVNPFYTQGGRIEVCGNEQFYLGRDAELCRYSWSDDLTISRKHLRIHCILYEQDPIAQIAPFVYATDLSANGTYLKKSNPECAGSQDQGILMGDNNCFLLEHGDELRISATVTLVYFPVSSGKEVVMSSIQQCEISTFASRYFITGRMLGEGGYGRVLIATHQETKRQLACKVVPIGHLYDSLVVPNLRPPTGTQTKRKMGPKQRWPTKVSSCFREFDILKDLSHPNVITLEKVFWSPDTIYLFQELVTGGDLFSFLEYKGGRLSSLHSAVIIRQVLKGIEYLHGRDIVHRDLKPDNILMTSLEDGARVVITDFGNARLLPNGRSDIDKATNKYQRMFSYVGTLEFAAPEIHKANKTIPADAGYSKSVDMWSIGSITATILTGDVIFTDRTHPKYEKDPRAVIMTLAGKCDLSVLDDEHHPVWSTIDVRPKDFIRRLLMLEEEVRMTAAEALVHPWFSVYAEDYEEQYARSIQNWVPRERDLELVERVSNFVPGLPNIDVSRKRSGEVSTSHFFRPSDDNLALAQDPSITQTCRANTPLPSIWEDFKAIQSASQVRLSYDIRNVHHARLTSGHTNDESTGNDRHAHVLPQLQDIDIETATSELPSKYAAVSSEGQTCMVGDSDFSQSSESLNMVSNNYSQQGYGKISWQPQDSGSMHGSIQVDETPLDDLECLQQFPQDDEPDSILAYDTPPDFGRKHRRSVCDDLLT